MKTWLLLDPRILFDKWLIIRPHLFNYLLFYSKKPWLSTYWFFVITCACYRFIKHKWASLSLFNLRNHIFGKFLQEASSFVQITFNKSWEQVLVFFKWFWFNQVLYKLLLISPRNKFLDVRQPFIWSPSHPTRMQSICLILPIQLTKNYSVHR